MIKVFIYKLDEKIAEVTCNSSDKLTIKASSKYKKFVEELKSDEYASNREFVRDLPERLTSYIHARLIKDG